MGTTVRMSKREWRCLSLWHPFTGPPEYRSLPILSCLLSDPGRRSISFFPCLHLGQHPVPLLILFSQHALINLTSNPSPAGFSSGLLTDQVWIFQWAKRLLSTIILSIDRRVSHANQQFRSRSLKPSIRSPPLCYIAVVTGRRCVIGRPRRDPVIVGVQGTW